MLEIVDQFTFWSAVDIISISAIIYHILLLIRGTRTAQILTGIIIISVGLLLSSTLPLTTLSWVMNKFSSSFIIIIIIIFQDDIRHALSRLGKKSIISPQERISTGRGLDELIRASTAMANKKMGALIILERNIILTRYIDVGIRIDAEISKELLLSIFHTSSPIHDGAVIVQQGRLTAAGCFLPLTREESIDPNLGTRHRAAIGISQQTDSVVVVISEENSSISIVIDGKIYLKKSPNELRRSLRNYFLTESSRELFEPPKNSGKKNQSFWKRKKPDTSKKDNLTRTTEKTEDTENQSSNKTKASAKPEVNSEPHG